MMKKSLAVMAMTIALAMSAMPVALAGGAADKATGDVTWTSQPGVEGYRTVFDAHEDRDGRPAKGEVTFYHPDGGKRIVDIECAEIDGNEGSFAGPVTYADGAFAGSEGVYYVHWVQDNATPGEEGDGIGSMPGDCSDLGWVGGGTVTDGNLQVHAGESEA